MKNWPVHRVLFREVAQIMCTDYVQTENKNKNQLIEVPWKMAITVAYMCVYVMVMFWSRSIKLCNISLLIFEIFCTRKNIHLN